jgi:hypothetical protein
VKYQDVVLDTAGNAISGVSITVKVSGTATLATLYTDNTYAVTASNPITSGSDGAFSFFCKDNRVDLSFVKTGYSFSDQTAVDCYNPLGDNIKTPADFITTDISAASTGAIAKIGSTVTTLLVNAPLTCTLDATIPSTLSLVFIGQGSITVSSGKTLTVNGAVCNMTGINPWLGSGTKTFGAGSGSLAYGLDGIVAVTYSASMTPDLALGRLFKITATNGTAFTINNPSNLPASSRTRFTIQIINSSGGALGTLTLGAGYKIGAAWTQPANSKNRFIEFECNTISSSTCYEVSRSAADVSN